MMVTMPFVVDITHLIILSGMYVVARRGTRMLSFIYLKSVVYLERPRTDPTDDDEYITVDISAGKVKVIKY
jgi:hypothetical protein